MKIKSIEDIAKLAGVSKTAVSAVINGKADKYRISKKTQEHIKEIIEKYDYTPNQVARSLRTQKTHTIGLIVPDLTNVFFAKVTRSLETAAREHSYQVLIADSNENLADEKRAISNLASRSIDGLIIATVMVAEELEELEKLKIPTVFIDREVESDSFSWVTSKNLENMEKLMRTLTDQGVNEVAYIGRRPETSTSTKRYQGYLNILEEAGIKKNDDIIQIGDDTREWAYQAMKNIYEKNGRLPEALCSSAYLLTEGILRFLIDEFGEIPSDMKIATFDNVPELDYLHVKIQSVQQDWEGIATTAYELLRNAMDKKPTEHRFIDATLIKR